MASWLTLLTTVAMTSILLTGVSSATSDVAASQPFSRIPDNRESESKRSFFGVRVESDATPEENFKTQQFRTARYRRSPIFKWLRRQKSEKTSSEESNSSRQRDRSTGRDSEPVYLPPPAHLLSDEDKFRTTVIVSPRTLWPRQWFSNGGGRGHGDSNSGYGLNSESGSRPYPGSKPGFQSGYGSGYTSSAGSKLNSDVESKKSPLDLSPTNVPRHQDSLNKPLPQDKEIKTQKPALVPEIWKDMFDQESWDSMEAEEIWKTVRCDPEWENVCPVDVWKSLLRGPGSAPLFVISRFILNDPKLNVSSNPELLSVFASFYRKSEKDGEEETTKGRDSEFPSFYRPLSWLGPYRPKDVTVRHFRYGYGTGTSSDLRKPGDLLDKPVGDVRQKIAADPSSYGMRWKSFFATSNHGRKK